MNMYQQTGKGGQQGENRLSQTILYTEEQQFDWKTHTHHAWIMFQQFASVDVLIVCDVTKCVFTRVSVFDCATASTTCHSLPSILNAFHLLNLRLDLCLLANSNLTTSISLGGAAMVRRAERKGVGMVLGGVKCHSGRFNSQPIKLVMLLLCCCNEIRHQQRSLSLMIYNGHPDIYK